MNKKQKNQENTPKKASITSINGTPEPPTFQQQQNHQTNKSENFIQKQQKIIEELTEKLDHLKETISTMEGELTVVRNVNTLLLHQLGEADSYSRRSCTIVTSL